MPTQKEESKTISDEQITFDDSVPVLKIDLTKDLECDNLLDKLSDLNLNSGLASGLLADDLDDNKEINSFEDMQANFEK